MMNKLKIKKLLTSIFSSSGMLSSYERSFFLDKAFILTYHRILTSIEDQPFFVQPGMFVSAKSFEDQIAHLKERFEIIFLEELVQKLIDDKDISGCCVITFDDGWLDNYINAFPILRKHNVPATIFLATGFVGSHRLFWPEELSYYLECIIQKSALYCDSPLFNRFINDVGCYDQNKRESFFDRSIGIFKGYTPTEREELLSFMRGMFARKSFPRQMISWDEARTMLASGMIHFGSHTVNHEILDQVPIQTVRDEIKKSDEEIEYHLGTKVRTFAYPNGNHNENIHSVLVENGFDAAVTTRKGFVTQNTALMEIPRIGIHEDISSTLPMFRARIRFKNF